MGDNQYLIPANTKKSLLIFNMFRGIDLMIFLIGTMISLVLLFALPGDTVKEILLKLSPIGISGFLVMPLPYYHNVLTFLQEVLLFYTNKRIYLWKGWCVPHVTEEQQK